MVATLKLPFQFDGQRLRQDMAYLQENDWIEHFVKQNYDGRWSVIPLRCQADATHPVMTIYSNPDCESWVDRPALAKCAYFQSVLSVFQCPVQAVRLMRLASGSVIKPHCDHGLSLEDGHIRLHIPIITNPNVVFYIGESRVVMDVGECWYLRFSDEHSVVNAGVMDRIHMVIDAQVNGWILEVFKHQQEGEEFH